MNANELFDDEGELMDWIPAKMNEQRFLEGEEAIAFIAMKLAQETHGNYLPYTLFFRAELETMFNVRIEKK